jgi:ribosome-associated heat shock protein Hsp15
MAQIKEQENLRIDKWLWAVRLFKTRNKAAEAIKKGHVTINGQKIKPSREIKKGEIVNIRRNSIIFSFKVLGLLSNRQSAKIVVDYVKDVTSPEEIEKLELLKAGRSSIYREKGTGRPTKKERRILDDFLDDWENWEEW